MVAVLLLVAVLLVPLGGCRSPMTPGMSQNDAWAWIKSREAERFLDEHPVVTLHPDQPVPEDCEYMEMVAAGPGIGVASEQHNVLVVAALMGATHVQWQDVETAHAYRCPEANEEDE